MKIVYQADMLLVCNATGAHISYNPDTNLKCSLKLNYEFFSTTK